MTVLASLSPLPTPAEMRRWDAESVALGLPGMLLMENAARVALHVLLGELAAPLHGKRALIFMGAGNNGGDAACLARLLHDAGVEVLVLHTRPLKDAKGETRQHVRVAYACGVPFIRVPVDPRPVLARLGMTPDGSPWRQPDIVVDGLLGTGFTGSLRPPLDTLIDHINALATAPAPPFILALDVPSGLDARTGRPAAQETGAKLAVRATATASFAAAKPGLIVPEARPFVGRLHVGAIGIPARVREAVPPSFRLLDGACAALLPSLPHAAYKNAFGHVLVLGGSPGLTGAAHLAGRAALRCGAGLVSVAAPAALTMEIKGGLADIMTVPLPKTPRPEKRQSVCTGESWPANVPTALHTALARAQALVMGPGMGQSGNAARLLEQVLGMTQRPPTVLDADALNMLAHRPFLRRLLRPGDILTPHPGEAARLLGMDATAVQADRPEALHRLAALAPCVWILKGAGTLVRNTLGPTVICPYDIPPLAVAGSGDVLSGCAGAMLARGVEAQAAAVLAVGLHARAGLLLEMNFPARGNSATDIAETLPHAFATLAALPRVFYGQGDTMQRLC